MEMWQSAKVTSKNAEFTFGICLTFANTYMMNDADCVFRE